MRKILSVFLVPVFTLLFTFNAKAESLTLGWAAWDPANALQELSKEFTAETGVEMNFEFVPWPNFADRMLNELNNQGKTFDLLIGDSQWIGAGATYGHYVKLNDFLMLTVFQWTTLILLLCMLILLGQKVPQTTMRFQRWVML